MVLKVKDETKELTSGRVQPLLTTIATSIHGNVLQLDAKGHTTLSLPLEMVPSENTEVHHFKYVKLLHTLLENLTYR